jgi:hypothetical protein
VVTTPTYDAALLVAELETAIAKELADAGFAIHAPTLAIREVVSRYYVWSRGGRGGRVLCGVKP